MLARFKPSRPFLQFLAGMTLLGAQCAWAGGAPILLVGIDEKFAFDNQGKRQTMEGGHDRVQVYALDDPAHPQLVGELPLENSVVGPPTNLAVTPDQRYALIADSLHSEMKGDTLQATPADEVFVLDLHRRPIELLARIKVGKQASGVAIDASGSRALVANRADGSVSLLQLDGAHSKLVQTLPLDGQIASVAFTPDGQHALAVKFDQHRVAWLKFDEHGLLTPAGPDITVGPWPYTVTVSPDGRTALVGNTGNKATSDGHTDTVSVIALDGAYPRTVDHVVVGDAPEGLAFSPRGGQAIVSILQGSYDAPTTAWWHNAHGALALLRADATGTYHVTGRTEVGAFPEGVAYSPDGTYAYVGNFASHTLDVLKLTDTGFEAGAQIDLPGPPAALRVGSQ